MNRKHLSIKQITIIGLFLAILIIIKFLDNVFFQFNNLPIIEFSTILALLMVNMLPFYSFILLGIIAPFFWILFGQIQLYNPFGIFLDYFLPFLIISIFKIHFHFKGEFFLKVIFFLIIKLSSHALSGMLFFETSFINALWINFPFSIITISSGVILILILQKRLTIISKLFTPKSISEIVYQLMNYKLQKIKLLKWGYLNNTYLILVNDQKWTLRIPKSKRVNWENEILVYKKLYESNFFYDLQNGIIIKPFIEGNFVKKWDDFLIRELKDEIDHFHNLEIQNLAIHNWNEHNKYHCKIDQSLFKQYLLLVSKYEIALMTVSHNDLNGNNVILKDKKLHLIDYEWTRLNHKYYDYANFYLFEKIHINPNLINEDEYKDIIFMTLIFNLLWTYNFTFSIKVLKIRIFLKSYLKLYNDLIWKNRPN